MKNVLLIFACAFVSLLSAQNTDYQLQKAKPFRFPPPPIRCEVGDILLESSMKAYCDADGSSNAGLIQEPDRQIVKSDRQAQNFDQTMRCENTQTSDTGGGGVIVGGGKKLDGIATGGLGGIKLPPDGKKVDVAANGATGGNGQGIQPGKKYDIASTDTGGSTIGSAGTSSKKLDALDSGGATGAVDPAKKKVDAV